MISHLYRLPIDNRLDQQHREAPVARNLPMLGISCIRNVSTLSCEVRNQPTNWAAIN
jgi:hypothetical protein